MRDSFQAFMKTALIVVLLLVANVSRHPILVAGAKTDHTVADLPLLCLLSHSNLLIHVIFATKYHRPMLEFLERHQVQFAPAHIWD